MKAHKRGILYFKTAVVFLVVLTVFCISANGVRAAGPMIPNSFFLENPYSYTGFRANVEVVDLDDPPGGVLIMNQYRVDINIFNNFFGLYAKFPFAGVIDFGPDSEFNLTEKQDDYDFGNIGIGGKFALLNLDYLILTAGFEVILPTASDGLGAQAAQAYFRDFVYFIDEAITLDPYLVLGVGSGMFALQGNLDFDIITNADKIDTIGIINTGGDDIELIIEYGGTASITPPLNLPFSTTILVEVLAESTTTFDDNFTAVYVTPGLRFGGQIVSVGAGVQIPVADNEVTDFANVEVVDLDDPPGGVLIMNQYRVDINLYQNLFGLYAKFPFAGVIDFGPDSVTEKQDDYDFGNIGIGGKFALLNLDYLILTAGFEVILPTASGDLGAQAAQAYFRDFVNFIDEAITLDPYLVLGVGSGMFALQGNIDFDIITNADKIDTIGSINTGGDDVELIIKYGGTASITPPLNLPFSTTILVEVLAESTTSFDDNFTAVYVTPGLRFGGQIVSIGAGVQIPVADNEVTDFANVDFLFDLIIRFGS